VTRSVRLLVQPLPNTSAATSTTTSY